MACLGTDYCLLQFVILDPSIMGVTDVSTGISDLRSLISKASQLAGSHISHFSPSHSVHAIPGSSPLSTDLSSAPQTHNSTASPHHNLPPLTLLPQAQVSKIRAITFAPLLQQHSARSARPCHPVDHGFRVLIGFSQCASAWVCVTPLCLRRMDVLRRDETDQADRADRCTEEGDGHALFM